MFLLFYLDLQAREDRAKLDDPAQFPDQFEDRLVVLDEIHRVPELFSALRGRSTADAGMGERHRGFSFWVHPSMDLLRQSSESLAGRVAYVEMGPLDVLETSDVGALWIRGGFPESYLASSDRTSLEWRKDFIRTYVERDVPLLGPRVPAETLERLWTMLAHEQAALLNASRLAAALMISSQTVTRYIDLLVDLLLVRRLRPFHGNEGKRLVKSPKVFVRDSGIVHSLLGSADYKALSGHPAAGASW
jgi:predicted AAA+ superfamily ATPase